MTQSLTPRPDDQDLPAPMLIGAHPALDFLNSCFTPHDEQIDLIGSGPALLSWLVASGVAPVAKACAANLTPRQLDAAAAEARALREWFRQLLFRWNAEGARGVRKADLDKLNSHLSKNALHQQLCRHEDGFELRTECNALKPDVITADLAATCADLLANLQAEQVRKCENPACTLWFADTKRGPKRRWCSMAACGNRMKVAAHRARHQT